MNTGTETALDAIPVGLVPTDVALDPILHRAYVVNGDISTDQWTLFNRNAVSVIDTRTDKVITTLRVSRGPLRIVVDAAAHRAYVLSAGHPDSRGNTAGTLSVINTTTTTIVGTLSIGINPLNIAVDPGLHRAFVLQGWNGVSVLNLAPLPGIVSSIPIAHDGCSGIAVDPIAHRAYVTDTDKNTLVVINTVTQAVIGTVLVGSRPTDVAVDPALHRVYVLNTPLFLSVPGSSDGATTAVAFMNIARPGPNTLSVLDTSWSPVKDIATVNVGTGLSGLTVDLTTHRLYMVNRLSDTITVVGYSPHAHRSVRRRQ